MALLVSNLLPIWSVADITFFVADMVSDVLIRSWLIWFVADIDVIPGTLLVGSKPHRHCSKKHHTGMPHPCLLHGVPYLSNS